MQRQNEWIAGTVYGFSLSKTKPALNGWILVTNFHTWWIFRATNPAQGHEWILTNSTHGHYSDHPTVYQAKQYAEQGGHVYNPQTYENRRGDLRL